MEVTPNTTAASAEEQLTDVPAALAPGVVPPISNFDMVVSQPQVQLPADKKERSDPRSQTNAHGTATTSPYRRPAHNVPAKGAFSLRSSAAVLSRSPAKTGEREVEAAGWDAAAYPYDETTERDGELDNVIDDLVHAIEQDGAINGREGEEKTTNKAADAPTPPSSATSSTATAPPSRPAAAFEKPDSDYAALHSLNCPSDARRDAHAARVPAANGEKATCAQSTSKDATPISSTDSDSSENRAGGAARADSPASDRWKVLSPPRQTDEYDNHDSDDSEEFNANEGRRSARLPRANIVTELKESSPVNTVVITNDVASQPQPSSNRRTGRSETAGKRGADRAARRAPKPTTTLTASDTAGPLLVLRVAPSTKTSPHKGKRHQQGRKLSRERHLLNRMVPDSRDDLGAALAASSEATKEQRERSEEVTGLGTAPRRGSYTDPTISWERRLSAQEEEDRLEAEQTLAEEQTVTYPKTAEHTTMVGEFYLATEARRLAAEARHRVREARKREAEEKAEQLKKEKQKETYQKALKLSVSAKPKGYDAIAEEGRRKRQQLEADRQRKQQEAEANLTFKPKLSTLAMEKKRLSASSTGAQAKKGVTVRDVEQFVAASKEWEEKREHNLAQVQRQLAEAEEAERKRRFVNEESERIASRRRQRQQPGTTNDEQATNSVFDRLAGEAESRRAFQKQLEEKYTPSFQPETNHSTSPIRSAEGNASASPEGKAETSAEERAEKTSISYFEDLYQRSTQRKAEVERHLEKQREAAAAAAAAQARGVKAEDGEKKRSNAEIEAYLEQMAARDAERRAKFEQKVQRERETEEEAAAQAGKASLVNPHSAQIAKRGHQRMQMREEQKRRARELEEQQRRKEEEAAAKAATALKRHRTTPAKLPPSFESHEMRSEERRARNLGRLRQELLEQEMAECTFKPRMCPASEEMASRLRYSQSEEIDQGANDREEFDTYHVTPHHAPLSLPTSLERASRPVVAHPLRSLSTLHSERLNSRRGSAFSFPRDTQEPHADIDASPAPRQPHGGSRNGENQNTGSREQGSVAINTGSTDRLSPPRSTISLEQEINSLEQVLQQWKQMENDVAAK